MAYLAYINIYFHKNGFRVFPCQLLENWCNSLARSTPKVKNSKCYS